MLNNSNDLLGQTLGTCTLQRMIGRGGMGAVYLAQQSRPKRSVAVKVLLPGITEQRPREEFLARFRREADAIASLDHVNIMPIYEYGEQGEVAFLVMPYVNGGTLREMLEKRGPLPLDEVATTLEQIATGLDNAHAQGIVHRDLKPGNILFHADGRVLIADFGLAKVVNDTTESITNNGHLTSTGTIVGTPEYLSPEQGTGDAIDYRTDVYSLGVVVYHMLAGRVPYSGVSPVAVAIKHAIEEPPPITRFNPAIPASVEQIVLKAMAKSPAKRYASAGEFALAFYKEVAAMPGSLLPTINGDWTHSPFIPKFSTPLPFLSSTPVAPAQMDLVEARVHEAPTALAAQPEIETPTRLTNSSPEAQSPAYVHETVLDAKNGQDAPVVLTNTYEEDVSARSIAAPPSNPTMVTPMDVTVAEQVISVQQPSEQTHEDEKGEQLVLQTLADEHVLKLPVQRRTSTQSMWLVVIGCVLALFIIAGIFTSMHIAVPHITPTQPNNVATHSKPTAKAANTPIAHGSSTASASTPTPSTSTSANQLPILPGAISVPHSAMIYGTAQPGNCDKKGEYWSVTPGTQLSCSSSGMQIQNTSTTELDGVVLRGLPTGKTLPSNYLVQVDTTINPSQIFGIFFRAQQNSLQNGYVLFFDPSVQNMRFEYYQNGSLHLITAISTQNLLTGTVTVDIVVQSSNTFLIYINGTQIGNAYSTYGYSGGTVALVAQQATTVTFKNFELYPLQ